MLNKLFASKLFAFTKDVYVRKLILFGLLIRFIIILFYTNVTIYPDSSGFLELSDYLLNFDLSGYEGYRTIGYPFLIFLGFGNEWLVVIYQFFIGVYGSVVLYKTAVNLDFSSKFSFIISLISQSFLNVLFYETAILSESLTLFFMMLLMYEISKGYFSKTNLKSEIWMGFILGYLVLIKPFYAYIGFLIYGLSLLQDFKWNKIISKKIIILILPLFAYFGWSYVNKVNTGYFVSTTYFGLNLSQNCVYFAEKGPKEYDWIMKPYVKYREIYIEEDKDVAMTIWGAYETELQYSHTSLPDFSAELGKYAMATVQMNPKEYLKQVVCRSWVDFWKPAIYWNYNQFNFKYANMLFLLIWYFQLLLITVTTITFIVISLYYISDYFKTKIISFEFFGVLLVWVTSILQALVTYGTNAKYRFPFEFVILLVVILFFRNKKMIPSSLNNFLQ